MGKNLIIQKRGRGGPRYRAPSHRYVAVAQHRAATPDTIPGTIKDFHHCPGHSAPLVEIRYGDGRSTMTIAAEGMHQGDTVATGAQAQVEIGNTAPLASIPEGTLIHNIELMPGDGGKFVRAAGTFAKVLTKKGSKVSVLLPSKKEKEFDLNCRASIGIVAGSGRLEKPILKAGIKFYKMRAKNKLWPKVAGQAMNALSHPHGGSRTSKKNKPTVARRFAPAGANVGLIRPHNLGRRVGKNLPVRQPKKR